MKKTHPPAQAAADARTPLRPITALASALRANPTTDITGLEFRAIVTQGANPAYSDSDRSMAFGLALKAAHHTPKLVTPLELARFVTLHNTPDKPVLQRHAGNILGMLLVKAQSAPHPSILVLYNRLPPHKVPALLDMGGHIQVTQGVPLPHDVAQMIKLPNLHSVATAVTLQPDPRRFVQHIMHQGNASDIRHVVPTILQLLQKAADINTKKRSAFRGAGVALRAVVKELTSSHNIKTIASVAPHWPQHLQKLVTPPSNPR